MQEHVPKIGIVTFCAAAVVGLVLLLGGDLFWQVTMVLGAAAGLAMGLLGLSAARSMLAGLGASVVVVLLHELVLLSTPDAGRHVDGAAMAAWMFLVLPLQGLGFLVSFALGRFAAWPLGPLWRRPSPP
jgi:hypothetical protein